MKLHLVWQSGPSPLNPLGGLQRPQIPNWVDIPANRNSWIRHYWQVISSMGSLRILGERIQRFGLHNLFSFISLNSSPNVKFFNYSSVLIFVNYSSSLSWITLFFFPSITLQYSLTGQQQLPYLMNCSHLLTLTTQYSPSTLNANNSGSPLMCPLYSFLETLS